MALWREKKTVAQSFPKLNHGLQKYSFKGKLKLLRLHIDTSYFWWLFTEEWGIKSEFQGGPNAKLTETTLSKKSRDNLPKVHLVGGRGEVLPLQHGNATLGSFIVD